MGYRLILGCGALFPVAADVAAQVIEVQVTDSVLRAPIPSAIVSLFRQGGTTAERRLTDLRGRAVCEVTGAGIFHIAVKGIGYARSEGGVLAVRYPADTVRRVIRLAPISVVLPDLQVTANDACSAEGGGIRGEGLSQVWEEARTGLEITVLTEDVIRPRIERWTGERLVTRT